MMTFIILLYAFFTLFINSKFPAKQAKINAIVFIGYIPISIFWFFTISHWFIVLTIWTVIGLIYWIRRTIQLGKKEVTSNE